MKRTSVDNFHVVEIGDGLECVFDDSDGILFSRKPDGRLAWPGAVVFRIAGAKVLAHRKGMSGLDD